MKKRILILAMTVFILVIMTLPMISTAQACGCRYTRRWEPIRRVERRCYRRWEPTRMPEPRCITRCVCPREPEPEPEPEPPCQPRCEPICESAIPCYKNCVPVDLNIKYYNVTGVPAEGYPRPVPSDALLTQDEEGVFNDTRLETIYGKVSMGAGLVILTIGSVEFSSADNEISYSGTMWTQRINPTDADNDYAKMHVEFRIDFNPDVTGIQGSLKFKGDGRTNGAATPRSAGQMMNMTGENTGWGTGDLKGVTMKAAPMVAFDPTQMPPVWVEHYGTLEVCGFPNFVTTLEGVVGMCLSGGEAAIETEVTVLYGSDPENPDSTVTEVHRIGIFGCDVSDSTFGSEDHIRLDLWWPPGNESGGFMPMAIIGTNPDTVAFLSNMFSGLPAYPNNFVVSEDVLKVDRTWSGIRATLDTDLTLFIMLPTPHYLIIPAFTVELRKYGDSTHEQSSATFNRWYFASGYSMYSDRITYDACGFLTCEGWGFDLERMTDGFFTKSGMNIFTPPPPDYVPPMPPTT